MTVQWFPGHMAKARRQIQEKLKLVDIVYELLDARIPYSSSNPMMNEIIKHKPKLIILNKADIADATVTQQWVNYFKQQNQPVITVDALHQNAIKQIVEASKEILKEKFEKEKAKGLRPRPIRAMILGIPNVGKSTLTNNLAKRKAAQTGDRPGVTKAQQWIKVEKELELLDTPGVLWPKFESQEIALNLAFTGTIKDDLIERVEVAFELLKILEREYLNNLKERYKISDEEYDAIKATANPTYELMRLIGKKRGALVSGGNVDDEKTARIILDDFRNCKIGRISLEKP